MDRDMKDLLKLLAALAALVGAVVAGVLLILRYKGRNLRFLCGIEDEMPLQTLRRGRLCRRGTQ